MPSILFLHENYPAQFGAIAGHLASNGWTVVFGTARENFEVEKIHKQPNGVSVIRYQRSRDPREDTHRYLVGTEKAVLNGQGFARAGAMLKKSGFKPDVIVAHSGWGSGSFAKVIWPNARLVQYLEWWYRYPYVDAPAGQVVAWNPDDAARTMVRNLPFMLDFQQADLVIVPTQFQAEQTPDFVRQKLRVQHDGVDCEIFRPLEDGEDPFTWDGLPEDARILTFATRGMEPTRGFPTFMEAAANLLAKREDLHVVIAGGEKAHYGGLPDGFKSWKDKALADHDFDLDRVHFTGLLPKSRYRQLLQRSDAHVYQTRPFVLSWSMIEAMAVGCPMVASDVAPVREAAGSDDTVRLVAPENAQAVIEAAGWCLDNSTDAKAMGLRARARAVQAYDRKTCHSALEQVFSNIAAQQAV